jgi:hypothetical protein
MAAERLVTGDRSEASIERPRRSLNPSYGAAYRVRGNVKRKKGDINGADADLNQVVKLGAKS